MSQRDHYEVLGVSRSASADEIKAAFRKLAAQHHPDKNGGDRSHEKALQAVIEAYTALKSRPAFA